MLSGSPCYTRYQTTDDSRLKKTYDPLILNAKHVHDKICRRLRAVDRPAIPAFRQIGIVIGMRMSIARISPQLRETGG